MCVITRLHVFGRNPVKLLVPSVLRIAGISEVDWITKTLPGERVSQHLTLGTLIQVMLLSQYGAVALLSLFYSVENARCLVH